MTVPMDGPVDLSSRDRAQHLFNKNVELQNKRWRSAQAKIPSDPSIWHKMRENYESIILEDHDFAEKHEVEFALWQLHYRRIEELRAHLNAAAPANTAAAQHGKESARPDRIMKIRSQFKSFLSEATGFYHDLILKIRAKYGLPLLENQMVTCKDGYKSADMKKGLISCHRCLIYVGDLSRYKGLYGDGDSKAGDFAAASSYYMQASSLWPPSGNPHHQLAILASYSGDELVAIYRYFRSLAVDSPFSTARDNLIIAFEKNRLSFTQLAADAKASLVKASPARTNGKGRGKGGAVRPAKNSNVEATGVKSIASTIAEIFRAFIIRFVRLNGILFTRTSLETFEDVFSVIKVDLLELLSSGPEEKYNFASAAEDNKIVIVRLIAVLIFTVHNVNRDTENQSYAEILQRSVLLENALTAVFEIMGLILQRSVQLHNMSSSFLLPGVLIFLEWLACHPEITSGSEVKEKQAAARSLFWNSCISFLNKLMSSDFASMDENADESFFLKMSSYDECETINRLALWEDFELRGFLPLAPAHQILDFSGKHFVGSDGGNMEEKMRIQRIISAGKALTNVVHIGHEGIYFDPKSNEFAIGNGPEVYDDDLPSSLEVPDTNDREQVLMVENQKNMRGLQPHPEGDEEDEVIVFRPSLIDKYAGQTVSEVTSFEVLEPGVGTASIKLGSGLGSIPSSVSSCSLLDSFDTTVRLSPTPVVNMSQQLHSIPTSTSQWLQQKTLLANGLGNQNLMGNVRVTQSGLPQHLGVLHPSVSPISLPPSVSVNGNECSARVSDTVVQSKFDLIMSSGPTSDVMSINPSMALHANSKKNPVSRPVRHLGPPPGFSPVPSKLSGESLSGITLKNENMQQDDYSWLDGYHLQSSAKGTGFNSFINQSAQTHLTTSKNSSMTGTTAFPFPGKQIPVVQGHDGIQRNWQEYDLPGRFKSYQDQLHQQQVWKINQQSIPMPGHQGQQSMSMPGHQGQQSIPMPGHQGQSWENRFIV